MPYEPLTADELKQHSADAASVTSAPPRPKPLTMGQNVVKFGADLLPPVGSFVGGLTGTGAGAFAGLGTPASIPEAIWGGGLGGAAGGAIGGAVRLGIYKAAGIPAQNTIGGMATQVATDAALGSAQGAVGGGYDALLAKGAPFATKLAIGRAAPGAENEVLASNMKPHQKWIAAASDAIGNLKQSIVDRLSALDASGKKANIQPLLKLVGGLKGQAESGNLLSRGPENALGQAWETLNEKIGPQTTTTPASTIVAPARGGLRSTSGPAVPATSVTTPAADVPWSRVQLMKEKAQDAADGLFADREAAQIAAKRSIPASPLEEANAKIASWLQKLIENEPTHGRDIGAANQEMQRLMRLRKIATTMAGRAPARATTIAAMMGSEIPAAYMHNPYAAVGLPLASGAATQLITSPSAQLGMARLMANPFARAASQLPFRAGVAAAQDITGIGIPRPDNQ